MTTDQQIATLAPKPKISEEIRKDAIELLKNALQKAEAGEVAGAIVILKHPDNTWSGHHTACVGFDLAVGQLEIVKQSWIAAYLAES